MSDSKLAGVIAHRRWLARCVAACLLVFGASNAMAQDTGGSIFGWGPAGQKISVKGVTSGMHRHVTVKSNGHYSISRLPLGVYTVTLEKDGKPVDTRSNISIKVGRGAEVDFACPDDQCAEQEGG
jgi:Carboxypeptidase regulatory-like domain